MNNEYVQNTNGFPDDITFVFRKILYILRQTLF